MVKNQNDMNDLALINVEQIQCCWRIKTWEYVEMISNPKKIITRNFYSRISERIWYGYWFHGTSAIGLYFYKNLSCSNLPFFGNFIAEIVKIVQDRL